MSEILLQFRSFRPLKKKGKPGASTNKCCFPLFFQLIKRCQCLISIEFSNV
uniref:Uncharacterized protein n=1 Tax=Arundo donax TaxID=35708 RepID=A0A0A8ZHX0_ARUDO